MSHVSPRTKAHGAALTWEMRKPHAGLLQFCVVFPDGDHYVWRKVEFHSQAKIDSNRTSGVSAVPTGWIIEEQGSTTIASGSSRKTVAHTLGAKPSRVELFLSNEATKDNVRVSSTDTNTNITITLVRSTERDNDGNLKYPARAVDVEFRVSKAAP